VKREKSGCGVDEHSEQFDYFQFILYHLRLTIPRGFPFEKLKTGLDAPLRPD